MTTSTKTSKTTAVCALLIALTLILATAREAEADLITYTSRSVWEAAPRSGDTFTHEDFENETTSFTDFDLPHLTFHGVTINELGIGSCPTTPVDNDLSTCSGQQFLASGLVNGTQEVHIRDETSGISWNPGFLFTAFGFDWDTAAETWDVKLGTTGPATTDLEGITIATLPSNSSGFFGVTGADKFSAELFSLGLESLSDFVLHGNVVGTGGQGGISVDNMVLAPEPSTFALVALGLLGIGCLRRKRA